MAPSALTDWNLLRSFLAVVETASLSRAATRLGLTQPSVSRHMRELEALLGETLFDRRPSGLVPTSRAQSLYEIARGMDLLARRAEESLGDAEENITGVVRVTTSEAFGVHVLPMWLATLLEDERELEIELHVSQRTENLIRRDADIAVRFVRPEQDGVIAKRVGQVRLGLFASKAYLARFGVPASLEDLAAHLVVGTDKQISAHGPATGAAHGPGPMGSMANPRTRTRFRTDSVLTRLAAVEAGMGIGPVLEPLAAARPQLQQVLADQLVFPSMEIWLCGHDDLKRSARIRRVYDYLDVLLSANFGHGLA
jgi:DNA-binding transcriptional LysR family regulator